MSHSKFRNRRRGVLKVSVALFVAAMVALGGLSVAAADDGFKIGYVDLHRALEESEEGQKIRSELEQEFEQRQQQLDEKQQEVMASRQQMEQQAMMLSEERRQQKAMELQRQMEELQQTYLTLQNELAQQEAEATSRLFDEMRSVIEEIGDEKGFTIVVDKSSVLYSEDGLDLTDEVIERYDARQ